MTNKKIHKKVNRLQIVKLHKTNAIILSQKH